MIFIHELNLVEAVDFCDGIIEPSLSSRYHQEEALSSLNTDTI